MTTSAKLGLELLQNNAANQTLANTTFAIIDQLCQAGVVDKDLATPPGSPANGALYIVASSPTGAWAGKAGQLAFWLTTVGAWTFIAPREGFLVHVNDEDTFYKYDGTAWGVFSGGGGGSGTVTSVALSAPTGFSVSGSPVTTSGTLALSFSSGYSLPTDANQANWSTAYGWGNHASAGYEKELTAGTNITIDRTDPDNPVISASGSGGMTNPMTTAGDLIKGGTGGTPERLGIGTSGQLLSVVSGSPAWVDPPSGAGDVVGPASATDDAIALFNGTTGKLLQDSAVLLSALERTLTAGSNITIDRTNPDAPVISSTASGSGDVVGPASAVNNGVALFDGMTGKLIKDGGALGTAAFSNTGDFATAAQGALADSALQSDDIGVSVQAQLVSGTNIKTVNSQSLLGIGNLAVTAAAPAVQSLTSSRNLVLADSNTVNVNSSSSAYTATIQAQADQAWVADTEIHFLKTGTGNIVITAATGVTLNGTSAGSVTISQQYGAATIKRISENVWVAVGVLAGAVESKQLCTAWVNFNGTGTVAIRDSYNVSSITDNNTGDYTVNFTVAMGNANYCVNASTGINNGSTLEPVAIGASSISTNQDPTVNGFRIICLAAGTSAIDYGRIMIQVFGGK